MTKKTALLKIAKNGRIDEISQYSALMESKPCAGFFKNARIGKPGILRGFLVIISYFGQGWSKLTIVRF